jgi:hypothetical protein
MFLAWETPPPTDFTFLSLGAGVQSSALALMAATGEVGPVPTAAIFADTQAEPASVYRWLDWLEAEIARSSHPFPVHRVTRGSLTATALEERITKDGRRYCKTFIPFFVKSATGSIGRVMHRSCTKDFKIQPITQLVRRLAGVRRNQSHVSVTQWLGISRDELQRAKTSQERWMQLRFPLIELGLTRSDCIEWMQRRGYPKPPRSSCVFCPFHSLAEWRRLRDEEPEAFAEAVQFERAVQAAKQASENFAGTPYLHKSCVPLDQLDLSTREERGQLVLDFADECSGVCGV